VLVGYQEDVTASHGEHRRLPVIDGSAAQTELPELGSSYIFSSCLLYNNSVRLSTITIEEWDKYISADLDQRQSLVQTIVRDGDSRETARPLALKPRSLERSPIACLINDRNEMRVRGTDFEYVVTD
jgi:hypothetical protein